MTYEDLLYEQQAAAMGIDTARRYLPPELREDRPMGLQPLGEDPDRPTRIEAEQEAW